MTTPQLERRIRDTDERLTRESERASKDLARWRYHWTLDTSNPDRVSLTEYARIVGRALTSVSTYARAYELTKAEPGLSIADALDRTSTSEEGLEAARAVAEVRGISTKTARAHYGREVREVRDVARERSARRGTDRRVEAQTAARQLRQASEQRERIRDEQKRRLGVLVTRASTQLESSRRSLINTIELLRDVEVDESGRDELTHDVERIESVIRVLRSILTGETGVDWDAELARLTEVS